MNRKCREIEVQILDGRVVVSDQEFDGYILTIEEKVIGEIAELDGQFAIIKMGNVVSFSRKFETAVKILIESYNLNK